MTDRLVRRRTEALIKTGKVPDVSIRAAQRNYKKALEKGLLKIMSKVGAATTRLPAWPPPTHLWITSLARGTEPSSKMNTRKRCRCRLPLSTCGP